MFSEDYSFFGLPFTLLSDSKDVIREFGDIYRRFKRKSEGGKDKDIPSVSISLLMETEEGRPVLITPDSRLILDGNDIPSSIYLFILNYAFREARNHFIIHGGVVEKGGRGIIISASSSVGKTTLILELVKRGFYFLSDELAPVRRNTGLIELFPRSIGMRNNGILRPDSIGTRNDREQKAKNEFKEMVDISDIPGGKIGNPCLPRCVIFLSPPLKEEMEDQYSRVMEIAFSRIDGELIRSLQGMEGIIMIERLDGRPYPTLRLNVSKTPVIERIEDICRGLGIFILNSHWGISEPPDYTATPKIERLQGSSGLIELAKHLLNGRAPSRLSQEFNNSQSRIMMELAGIFERVSFYRLTIGRLKDMADMVEELV
jgi:hypothetical protein